MSNIKISALGSASALDGTEEVPIVQGATTVKTTTQDIANLGGGSSYLVASVTLDNDQIKALPNNPFQLVAGQANKIIILVNAVTRYNILSSYTLSDSAPITGLSDLIFTYGANQINITTALTANIPFSDGSPFDFVYSDLPKSPLGNETTSINGAGIYFSSDSENGQDYIGGNAANTIDITLYYTVVDL